MKKIIILMVLVHNVLVAEDCMQETLNYIKNVVEVRVRLSQDTNSTENIVKLMSAANKGSKAKDVLIRCLINYKEK